MATIAQIQKLRRRIQDFYNAQTGAELTEDQYAFQDTELEDIIDDAAAEVSDGNATAEQLNTKQEAWAMLLSRADCMIQIAQDEARRIRWQSGNEIQDPTQVAPNLINAARVLQERYQQARKRELEEEKEGVTNRPIGARMSFNSTIKPHYERNFDNRTVRRNMSRDH